MSVEWCRECGTHHLNGAKCYPDFDISFPDWYGENEWVSIRAIDFEAAAERWADEADEERSLLDGGEHEIMVRNSDGEVKRFAVTGEVVASYNAREIEESTAPRRPAP